MSVEARVRRVLNDMAPNVAVDALLTESRDDGAALRSMDGPHDAFVGDSRSWADEMAESGFLVTMVRDQNGAHVEVF